MAAPLPSAYRPCVGMMVINDAEQVLVGHRIDTRTEAWQMPQGGIDEGEDIRQAALRELREEIGTDTVTIIAESKNWLNYDLPESLIPQLWGGKYRGQKQKWLLMHLPDEQHHTINIHTSHPEFRAIQWIEPRRLPELIVPFKRALYEAVLGEFLSYIEERKPL